LATCPNLIHINPLIYAELDRGGGIIFGNSCSNDIRCKFFRFIFKLDFDEIFPQYMRFLKRIHFKLKKINIYIITYHFINETKIKDL